jgi:hypothetical protein
MKCINGETCIVGTSDVPPIRPDDQPGNSTYWKCGAYLQTKGVDLERLKLCAFAYLAGLTHIGTTEEAGSELDSECHLRSTREDI